MSLGKLKRAPRSQTLFQIKKVTMMMRYIVVKQMICRRTQLVKSTGGWRRRVEWDLTRWIHN